jgi:hypothetical protein
MTRPTLRLLDRGYKKVLLVLVAGLLGSGLGFLALVVNSRLPSGSWQQQPQPPVTLTHFVGDAPMSYIHGVCASTADGTFYALSCHGEGCAWSRQDALFPPTQESWEGRCYEGLDKPDESIVKPKAPGRVVDTHATRYCWIDGFNDDYYILLDDGSVWFWTYGQRPMGEIFKRVLTVVCPACCGVGGLILGLLVVIVVPRVVARRSRSTQ